ncbi:MAG TPA: hypothetical protein VKP88_02885 [Candidatus Paceibacterota bacterium]|nr:hypothetical protein [Candidatus Paceibacterota bacterium]
MDNDQHNPAVATSETKTTHFDNSTVTLLIALGVLLVAVLGVSFYIYHGMQNTPASQVAETQPAAEEAATEPAPAATAELTDAQKIERLESLRANPDNLSFEEKMNRLEGLRTNN